MADLNPSKKSILVVNELMADLKTLTTFLSKKGFNVYSAQTGSEAIEITLKLLPDLILIDVTLPDIDGFEVCKIIKSNENTKDIPVVFISELSKYNEKVKEFEVVGIDFISKPYNIDEVHLRINHQLELCKHRNLLKNQTTETDSKYQFIVENTDDILWTMDENLKLDYVSPSIFTFLGYTIEEHLKQQLGDYMTPKSANMIKTEFGIGMMHLQKKEYDKLRDYAEFEVELIKKNKTTCFANIKLNFLRDSHHNIIKIRGVTIDLTKRKLAEKKIEEQHYLLLNLAEQVPGVIYQYRLYPDGRSCFPYSSPSMFNIYEVTPEEVREDATPVFGRIHPSDLGRISESIFESARTQTPYSSEFRVILPEQGLRWRLCHAQPQLLEDGSTLWHGMISDITDRVLAEKAIKKSEQKYNNIIKNLPGYVSHSIDFPILEIQYLSKGFEDITGYTIKEVLKDKGLIYLNSIYSDDIFNCTNIAKNAIEQNKSFEVEYRIKTKDGKIKWLWKKGLGIYDNKGNYLYTEGYSTDITERKIAEEELKLSENRYSIVANNSADVIFIINLEMKYTFVSPSVYKLRGYTPEELINKHVSYSLSENSIINVLAAVKEELELEKTGTAELNRSKTFELEMLRKDGTTIWTEIKASVLRDPNNKMIGFLGITRDITERIKTQEIIKKSNETYILISEKITDVVWLMDLTGKSTYVSPSIEKFTGYTVNEYLNQTINTRFTKESAKIGGTIFNTEIKKYIEKPKELTNYIKQLELEYICKNGNTKWGELIITPYFSENNILCGIHGVTRDITDRKQTEILLDKTSKQVNLILNLAGEGILGINIEGNISFVNPKASEILGYKNDELLGKHSHSTFHHTYPDGSIYTDKDCPHYSTLKDGKYHNGEDYFWKKDGSGFHVSYSSAPIIDNSITIGAVITFIDITNRKEHENSIIEKSNELERFNNIMVGREIRMIELKKEINELLKKQGDNEKYKIAE